MELELSEVSIRTLLDGSLMMVRERAMKHGITLGTEYDASVNGLSGTILADERKLKQVMYNLLSNAVKFTPEGGAVRLAARISSRPDAIVCSGGRLKEDPDPRRSAESWLCVSVTDTGIGIREEDQERIFAAFEQVDSSASRIYEGTGLGLSLTMKFVELHGGKVWVESEGEGKGSRFTFVIPDIRPQDQG